MSKRWRGLGPAVGGESPVAVMTGAPIGRFQTRTGHVCVLCGFIPTTKNKYRELQDHLVRVHFRDAIKAALPTRRPYLCPEKACNVEGKDWQALMRHYTGKHGVLDAYLKEALANDGIVTVNQETTVTATALRPEDLFLADNIIHHHEVIDPHHPAQQQSQVEVVTSFELPGMTTTLDPSHHQENHLGGYHELEEHPEVQLEYHHQSQQQQHHQHTQLHTGHEVTQIPTGVEEVTVDSCHEIDKGRKRTSEEDSDAAQINTVSSTIQFPTTIPLMLGATATKRAKTDPEVVINNGADTDNYAFVDLKYFLADPSKVMALPYKIILPQMEEEDIKCSSEDQVVQVDMLSQQTGNDPIDVSVSPPSILPPNTSISVQTQTDPPIHDCKCFNQRPIVDEQSTQTTDILEQHQELLSHRTQEQQQHIIESKDHIIIDNNNCSTPVSDGKPAVKELDFTMF